MQGTRGAHNKIILINLSLGFVTGLAPKAGKMIGLPKQERWAHHACSGLDGFVKLRKHKQHLEPEQLAKRDSAQVSLKYV